MSKLEEGAIDELDQQMIDYYYDAVSKGNKSISDIGSVYEAAVLNKLNEDLEKNIIRYPALKSLAEFTAKRVRNNEISMEAVPAKLKFKVQAMLANE